ncbi:hypothetical protein [Marichromatium gracile]|uniref:Transposase n=1 Tax=Marichromatium gracile TaxID=1048 RepID=A0A4R4AAB7_MARGR|nr:hypothetical protein [Marichromatium gracile]TCW35897.1 hypothetical protein EDC29_10571 [Marichromatium gracile]
MAEGVSKRRVCRLLGLSRSVLDDHARPRDDGPLIKALSALAERHPYAGSRKRYVRLRRAGHPTRNHKRVNSQANQGPKHVRLDRAERGSLHHEHQGIPHRH